MPNLMLSLLCISSDLRIAWKSEVGGIGMDALPNLAKQMGRQRGNGLKDAFNFGRCWIVAAGLLDVFSDGAIL